MCGAVALLCATTARAQGAQPSAAERAAIEAVIADENAAWERGDAEGFAAHAAPDVVFTNIIGMFSVGKAPFVAQHAAIFSTIYKGSRVSQAVVHIAMVRPDVAVVDTLTTVTGAVRTPPGVEAVNGAFSTRLEQVMTRETTGWSVAAFHNVVVNTRALAAASPAKP